MKKCDPFTHFVQVFRAACLVSALLAAFSQATAQNTNLFVLASSPSVPTPIRVAVADVNGDGQPELITANYLDDSVTVLTNCGHGIFASNATYSLSPGFFICSVVAADVNGDGKPDLICGSQYSLITVLTNNGSGGFGSNASYSGFGGPISVSVADFNGDGKPDLVCVNEGIGELTVLTNIGGGLFAHAAVVVAGLSPSYVLAADLNGDGKADLVCANEGWGNLDVFANDGNGGFAFADTLSVGPSPVCVIVADVNGDGKPDLISANRAGNSLTIYTNNGSHSVGIFDYSDTLYTGVSPSWVAAADVNGDGKPDLISANYGDGTLTIFTNNGIGAFGWYATINVGSGVNSGPSGLVAADVNGDGTPDLICADYWDAQVSIFTNAMLPGCTAFKLTSSPVVAVGPRSVAAADVNGDGKLELITGVESQVLIVLTNNGAGFFGSNASLSVGLHPSQVVAADINGDGRPDLIVSCLGANTTLIFFTNNWQGGFCSNATLSVSGQLQRFICADVNGDGRPDLVCAAWQSAGITVWTNDGSGGFRQSTTLNVPFPSAVAVADVNGDGKPEIICDDSSGLLVFTNDANGGFALSATLLAGQNLGAIVAADLNGDGKIDLVCADYQDGKLTVFTNNGSGGFALSATLSVGAWPVCVIAADVNGDGKPDLISADYGGDTLTLLTNNGSGGFGWYATLDTGASPCEVVAADINNDGRLELISANYFDSSLFIFCPLPFLAIAPAGANLAVSWPMSPGGFALQQNSSLNPATWVNATNAVSFTDGLNQALLGPPAGNQFYRLIR